MISSRGATKEETSSVLNVVSYFPRQKNRLKALLLPFSATSIAIQKVSADPQHKVMIKILIIQHTKQNKKAVLKCKVNVHVHRCIGF